MDSAKGSHRTRSKAAPDWTAEESLILVNEISAVESEWGATLPSFQKWQQIVENCNALDVNRNFNQCKRKWDALLSAYRRAEKRVQALDDSLTVELFDAVGRCVNGRGKSGGMEEEEKEDVAAAAEVEEQVLMETDPDSDPEAKGNAAEFFIETGSKKQRRRMKRKKRRIETRNPWGYSTSAKIKHEEPTTTINQQVEKTMNIVESMPDENNRESEEQMMATMLWENALQINAILEGNLADDLDYKLADLKNPEAIQTDLARRQGDELIDCFGKISATLKQLCELVQVNTTDLP